MTLFVPERFACEFKLQLDSGLREPAPKFSPRGARGPISRRSSGGINPVLLFVLFIIVVSILSAGRRRRGCGSGCLFIPFPIGGGWGGGTRGGWGGVGWGWGGGGIGGGRGGGGGWRVGGRWAVGRVVGGGG